MVSLLLSEPCVSQTARAADLSRESTLDFSDDSAIRPIFFYAVLAEVNPAVASRAKSDHMIWGVWTAIADLVDMMRLQVRPPIHSQKGRFRSAPLAEAICSLQDVGTNCGRPAVDISRPAFGVFEWDTCCGVGSRSQRGQWQVRIMYWIFGVDNRALRLFGLKNTFYSPQPEKINAVNLAVSLNVSWYAIFHHHFAIEAQGPATGFLGENEQVAALGGMIQQALVRSSQLLIACEALSSIFENIWRHPLIGVTGVFTLVNDIHRRNAWAVRAVEDARLGITSNVTQHVCARIELAADKWRRHWRHLAVVAHATLKLITNQRDGGVEV